jgi:nicotinamide mononucleotide transporter
MAYFLNRYTDSDVAIWDALVTSLSLLGQYLLAKKKIENWWVWMVVNVITVGLMLVKSLWLTALLYVLFAVLSYIGLKTWRSQHGQ